LKVENTNYAMAVEKVAAAVAIETGGDGDMFLKVKREGAE
jgi:hypothetical protein